MAAGLMRVRNVTSGDGFETGRINAPPTAKWVRNNDALHWVFVGAPFMAPCPGHIILYEALRVRRRAKP